MKNQPLLQSSQAWPIWVGILHERMINFLWWNKEEIDCLLFYFTTRVKRWITRWQAIWAEPSPIARSQSCEWKHRWRFAPESGTLKLRCFYNVYLVHVSTILNQVHPKYNERNIPSFETLPKQSINMILIWAHLSLWHFILWSNDSPQSTIQVSVFCFFLARYCL